MAPQHTQPIGFPALSDEFLEVFYAIWTFVRDLFLVLWSYVSEPFWDVWTYPPFETFRNEFVAALISLMGYVSAHPVTATAIAVLAFVVIPGVLNALAIVVLHCLARCRERGRRGMLRGSYAANYQSTGYDGNVRRGSMSAQFQSQGAKSGSGGGYRAVGGTGWR